MCGNLKKPVSSRPTEAWLALAATRLPWCEFQNRGVVQGISLRCARTEAVEMSVVESGVQSPDFSRALLDHKSPTEVGTLSARILPCLLKPVARAIKAFICALAAVTSIHALGQTRYVEFTSSPGAIRLGGDGVAAPIIVDSQDYPGVLRAAHDLQTDIERVTKIRPAVITDEPVPSGDVIIVGTLGKNRLI